MDQAWMVAFMLLVLAAGLDIAANMALAKSCGFIHKGWGISALVLVMLAFTCLAQAVREIDLAVAYATWGALGILGTALGGVFLLKQPLKPVGWLGIVLVVIAVVVMKTA
ncbi:multidrug transporter [Shewanella sp. NFH-SH190041]|uniref:SMR family transporter n=1 Tax=Shewanella sp. NFH-SH190041 TaxID=2950245 RepID=UPI0021C3C531|nr:SMR family transporter [Shewanella sp. NFH-SH190041]BDM63123.1 multidrug transporter [Shewanella sp. NFH-SH190041]